MYNRNYSIPELEKSIETKKSTEEKILFLSEEIIAASKFLEQMRYAINSIKNVQLAINTNEPNVDSLINDLLKNDGVLNNKIAINSICSIKDSLCERVDYFNNYAKNLIRHYWRQMRIDGKIEGLNDSQKSIDNYSKGVKSIIWKSTQDKLLQLFNVLNKNEIIPYYQKEDILPHFINAKLEPFSQDKSSIAKFIWQDSDSSFAIFINELSKTGVIEDNNKFKNVSEHFVNNRGEKFKYLSQKRNYSDNLNKRESLIKEVLSFL